MSRLKKRKLTPEEIPYLRFTRQWPHEGHSGEAMDAGFVLLTSLMIQMTLLT
jgi:hypothetical protein